MKINTKAFTITLTSIITLMVLIISIWTRLSSQFGQEFMDFFNSIHPHPFRATMASLTMAEEIYGVAIDLFYATIDSIIFSMFFCNLYNRLSRSSNQKKGSLTSENDTPPLTHDSSE